jgi:hypothetical protein
MSSESDGRTKGIITEVTENLGALFRHLLPGVLIIGVARVTHPFWFRAFQSASWPYLASMAVLAFAVGNAWFSINRYALHQFVDYVCWLLRYQGPAKSDRGCYLDHLAKYVRETVVETDVPERARQHVAFRASSVLLLYTLAELSLVSAVWSDPCAITAGTIPHRLLFVCSAFLFVVGVWQNIITRRIDAAVLHTNLVR